MRRAAPAPSDSPRAAISTPAALDAPAPGTTGDVGQGGGLGARGSDDPTRTDNVLNAKGGRSLDAGSGRVDLTGDMEQERVTPRDGRPAALNGRPGGTPRDERRGASHMGGREDSEQAAAADPDSHQRHKDDSDPALTVDPDTLPPAVRRSMRQASYVRAGRRVFDGGGPRAAAHTLPPSPPLNRTRLDEAVAQVQALGLGAQAPPAHQAPAASSSPAAPGGGGGALGEEAQVGWVDFVGLPPRDRLIVVDGCNVAWHFSGCSNFRSEVSY